ncbi:MAG TPA: hypothetical protein PLP88_12440 [Bacteroidales bacterium]|nr:hypothetical protein [Bacteroidales bacterium]
MALSTLRDDRTGRIKSKANRRADTQTAVGRENAFVAIKRKAGWSSSEARRVHRGRNKRAVQLMKSGISARRSKRR